MLKSQLVSLVSPSLQYIIEALNKDEYSLALRQASGEQCYALVKALVFNRKRLEININERSSNGNTALDWLDLKCLDTENPLYLSTRSILIQSGGLTSRDIENQLVLCLDEYSVSDCDARHKIISLDAVGKNFMLIAFCPIEKRTLVANISAAPSYFTQKKQQLLEALSIFSNHHLRMTIAGGWRSNPDSLGVAKMLKTLCREFSPKEIDCARCCNDRLERQFLCLNLLNGELCECSSDFAIDTLYSIFCELDEPKEFLSKVDNESRKRKQRR